MTTTGRHRRVRALVTAGAVVAIAGACASWSILATSSPEAGAGADTTGAPERVERLVVATTVAPITSIAAAIIGDAADIEGIVPEGTNSHTFEPPPSTAELLSTTDVLFLNGLQLEEPTKELAETNRKPGSTVVELGAETVTEAQYLYDDSFPEEAGKPNPHLWTDPPLAKRYGEIIRNTMVAEDPPHAATYRANFEVFATKLDQLDAAMRASFESLPAAKRKLLTYHDAYAYFAQDYGWEVVGAIQVADFEEPSPKEIADLIDQVEQEQVAAIFGSEVFPSAVLEQIGRETGVRYVDVLRDDDLPDEPGSAAHSLIGLLRFDYVTMTEALGGDASPLDRLDVSIPTPDHARYPQ
jgi:ABC-type Zn uptake system ZnuABC Zn-binding protein ZnuA